MRKLKAFFTHPVTISLLGLIILSLLIWFSGPYIKFGRGNVAPLGSTTARFLAIGLLLVLWGLNNLRLQWRDRQQNQSLVNDIQESHPSSESYTSTQASEEVAHIQQRFAEALNTLRQRRFRGRANKNRALYELPWYIIVGPPGAGKTTALINSGLEFPLAETFGKGALQGVGGTRHCDWWFTNDAVLVDTAGRYTTHDSHRVVDSSAWEGFLNLLKKHRRRRPINGVIVSVSVQDLLTQSEEERAVQARTIRSRIDELMTRLEVRFPVYLLLTKADLIAGFDGFFEDLGKEERDQVWGVSLPAPTGEDVAPDIERIAEELKRLDERLYDRVLWRMHQERDVSRRSAIEQFPQQMEQVNALVLSFVQQAFAPNRYRQQPYLRGAYYSSGTQDGTPIDRLMTAVSLQFGFSGDAAGPGYGRGKSFFLGRLFRDVIFPESELVGVNPKFECWRRWGRRCAYGAMTVVALGLVTVWTGSVGRHASQLQNVDAKLDQFEQLDMAEAPVSAEATLPLLTTLAHAGATYDHDKHPLLRSVGLYDGRINRRAGRAYQNYLKGPFSRALIEELESMLRNTNSDLPLYTQFRVYQMFSDVDRMDSGQVLSWFREYWSNSSLSGEQRTQLYSHLSNLLRLDGLEAQPLDESLARQVAQRLVQVPVARRVYSRIQAEPNYRRLVDLRSQYGDRLSTVFDLGDDARAASQIPWMFTREGYDAINLSPRSPVLRELVNDRWIFARLNRSAASATDEDLNDLSDQVKALYMSDYIRAWSRAIDALTVISFSSLGQGSAVLAQASDPLYSPLYSVLEVAARQTRLTDSKVKEAVANAGRSRRTDVATDLIASQIDSTVVDKHFQELHRLMGDSGGPAPIHTVLDEVRELNDFVQEIQMAPDPNRRSFEIARERFSSGAGSPITNVLSYGRRLPQPLEQWLTGLSRETWKGVLLAARVHVVQEWRAQVYQPYQRMASGRYPLVSGVDAEMSVYDFSEFFKPDGMHQQFFQEYIEPFVHTRGQWSNRTVDGYGLGLSGSALNHIRQGLEVTRVMFPEGTSSPHLKLEFRPQALSKDNARFSLNLDGEELSYNHGPKFWRSVEWSGDQAESRLRMIFEGVNGGVRDQVYQGPWAWLRALDEARVERTPQADVFQVTFSAGDGVAGDQDTMVYEVRARSVDNLLTHNPLRQYSCPEVL
ncbi:type VI secretion system membrane subunit TssM [Marinimicrobium sp. ARAG 43.8]|uniref:type VI secretion system membrane subunit TssM n=1 Tax=Marinimicrobium sp. ARAG 43.8 TaxID=3418719 RepID=UPI003CF2B7A8